MLMPKPCSGDFNRGYWLQMQSCITIKTKLLAIHECLLAKLKMLQAPIVFITGSQSFFVRLRKFMCALACKTMLCVDIPVT